MKSIKFLKLSSVEKRFFFEAVYETLWVRIVTTIQSAMKYASRQGQSMVETGQTALDARQIEQVLQIKTAVVRCRHLLWARKCLVESIAAKRMLNRRRIPATLYVGVAKNEKGKLTAHAWLRSGNIWATGGRNCCQYTVVGVFS